MTDVPFLRSKVELLRIAALDQLATMEAGKPRLNNHFAAWAVAPARAMMNELTQFELSPPEVCASTMLGACDAFHAMLDIIEGDPATAERLHSLLLQTAALIYGNVQSLAAPTSRTDVVMTRLNRRTREIANAT